MIKDKVVTRYCGVGYQALSIIIDINGNKPYDNI